MCEAVSDIPGFVIVPDLRHSEGTALEANVPNKTVYSGRFRLSPLITLKIFDLCHSIFTSVEFSVEILT